MFHIFLRALSPMQQGFVSVVVGFVLLFGALGKLGFLQEFLNIIMVIVGLYLLIFGLDKTNILKKMPFFKK
jgi:uncharacterized membrane protein